MDMLAAASMLFPEGAASVFNWCIVAAMALALLVGRGRYNNSVPNLLTSMGLLGTFFGILSGLTDFDHTAIDQSIPLLLAGLKLSFSSSVVGMLCSFLYKGVFLFKKEGGQATAGVTAEDLQASLVSINKAIGGEHDSSLTSQVSRMRTDIRDGNEKIVLALNKFAEELSKASVETIVQALKEVVSEFNQVVQEQFGENFKELNQAVLGLVTWLDRYKEHIEEMQARIDNAVQSLEDSEKAIKDIREHTAAIPTNMSALKETMGDLEKQRAALEESLGTLSSIREKAQQAFPALEEALGSFQNKYGTLLSDHLTETKAQLVQQTEAWQAVTGKGVEKINEASSAYSMLAQNLEQTSRTQSEAVSSAAQEMQSHFNKATEDVNTILSDSFNNFDQAMQAEVKRVIEEMGSQLASLSQQFANDYAPLTQNLKQLMTSLNNGVQQ